jgi:hypothetical protein
VLEEQARPESLSEAIIAKRKASKELSDKELVMSIPDLPEEEGQEDIAETPEPLPFPTSRADAIRRKFKALRGE